MAFCVEANGIINRWKYWVVIAMAHYKHIDTSPRFLAVDLDRQLLPGTFE
jgi:hypothetical protein